jgi:hypothetical protein
LYTGWWAVKTIKGWKKLEFIQRAGDAYLLALADNVAFGGKGMKQVTNSIGGWVFGGMWWAGSESATDNDLSLGSYIFDFLPGSSIKDVFEAWDKCTAAY